MNAIAQQNAGTVTDLHMTGAFDPGHKRSHNEDYFRVDCHNGLAIVADGMGGHNAGEVASRMAVDAIFDTLTGSLRDPTTSPQGGTREPFSRKGGLVRKAVRQANDLICRTARDEPQYQGMGTTIVATLFHGNMVSIGSVGDSRAYRLRQGCLEQLTRDHTLLQELIDRGYYAPEEAHASLNRNIVTRALGVEDQVDVDIIEDIVLPGDRYLLCSDGLNDMMPDTKIAEILARPDLDLATIPRELIEQANANGGKDNVTAAIVEVRNAAPARRTWLQRVVAWFQ